MPAAVASAPSSAPLTSTPSCPSARNRSSTARSCTSPRRTRSSKPRSTAYGGRSVRCAACRSSWVSCWQARKLATSLADTRTRPSVIFIDPHLPKGVQADRHHPGSPPFNYRTGLGGCPPQVRSVTRWVSGPDRVAPEEADACPERDDPHPGGGRDLLGGGQAVAVNVEMAADRADGDGDGGVEQEQEPEDRAGRDQRLHEFFLPGGEL